MAKDVYEGRLVADGNGNLLAYEAERIGEQTVAVTDAGGEPIFGEDGKQIVISVPVMRYGKNHDRPVAWDEDREEFVFLKPGEPSHNDRHHQNFVGVPVTQDQDPDQPGYAGTKDKPSEGNEHHFGVLEDDPHYEEGATNSEGVVTHVRPRQLPDSQARLLGGHTHQHLVGGDE